WPTCVPLTKPRIIRSSMPGSDSIASTAPEPKGRVLIADDDRALLRAYERALAQTGYEVVTAPDGQTAIELFRNGQFDVIITDLTMPGMNGIELLRAVRETDLAIPVVLITAGPSTDSAVQAVCDGA